MSERHVTSQFDADGCKEARFHEAGHAVGAIRSGIGVHPNGIKIDAHCSGVTYIEELRLEQQTEDWCLRRATVKLSGAAAETRMRNQVFHPETLESDCHYFQDYKEARELLWKFEVYRGNRQATRVDENLNEALVKAHNVISENWSDVERVARALLSKGALTSSDIRRILEV